MEFKSASRTRRRTIVGFIALAMLFGSLCVTASAADGPFGIAMGADPKYYPDCAPMENSPGVFFCNAVPQPLPSIRTYFLTAWPSTGVCIAGGVSDAIQTSDFGNKVRQSVDDLAAQIRAAYGSNRKVDALAAYSPWTEPQYWM